MFVKYKHIYSCSALPSQSDFFSLSLWNEHPALNMIYKCIFSYIIHSLLRAYVYLCHIQLTTIFFGFLTEFSVLLSVRPNSRWFAHVHNTTCFRHYLSFCFLCGVLHQPLLIFKQQNKTIDMHPIYLYNFYPLCIFYYLFIIYIYTIYSFSSAIFSDNSLARPGGARALAQRTRVCMWCVCVCLLSAVVCYFSRIDSRSILSTLNLYTQNTLLPRLNYYQYKTTILYESTCTSPPINYIY